MDARQGAPALERVPRPSRPTTPPGASGAAPLDPAPAGTRTAPGASAAGASPVAAALRSQDPRDAGWVRRYTRSLPLVDGGAALVAALVGYAVRFGQPDSASWWWAITHQPAWSVLLLPLLWVAAVAVMRGYESRFLFSGPEEVRRVGFAGVSVVAAVSTTAFAFDLQVARGYVVVALPLALLLTLLARLAMRRRVHQLRRAGRRTATTLVVGRAESVRDLVAQLERAPQQGMQVVGCCTTASADVDGLSVPVLGGFDDVVDVVRRDGIQTVAVLPCAEMDTRRLRRLGWRLEETTAELVVAPGIAEVAGPRVAIRPVAGLPLLHLERPELRGVRALVKNVIDRVGAALGVAVLGPVLVALAVLVKRSGPGPVFFRQERVGEDGQHFDMLKFRSMVDRADEKLPELMVANEGNGVLFKMKGDPRITPIGRVLRRYSLDELPQLFNVLKGEMSLVGPRPPLRSEVDRYRPDMHRRFAVKPGITGLWQVSGRSNLSAEESERLDVRYVESWSPATDAMILWKTVGSVVKGRGAY
ncbi:sugar transferase [uncultured Pseudokineococcus sp.]|uniref:sugar transferase n=1 Tax=uncultured Pseudokineococcus sp. TaxID=1642928 RepID=UPI002636CFD2|nr:sugar transferase [uncultured Pseudokineococcus sp.]